MWLLDCFSTRHDLLRLCHHDLASLTVVVRRLLRQHGCWSGSSSTVMLLLLICIKNQRIFGTSSFPTIKIKLKVLIFPTIKNLIISTLVLLLDLLLRWDQTNYSTSTSWDGKWKSRGVLLPRTCFGCLMASREEILLLWRGKLSQMLIHSPSDVLQKPNRPLI